MRINQDIAIKESHPHRLDRKFVLVVLCINRTPHNILYSSKIS